MLLTGPKRHTVYLFVGRYAFLCHEVPTLAAFVHFCHLPRGYVASFVKRIDTPQFRKYLVPPGVSGVLTTVKTGSTPEYLAYHEAKILTIPEHLEYCLPKKTENYRVASVSTAE